MKKLFCYLKDYRKECVMAPLFKLLEACFELFVPLVVADIIDRGIAAKNTAVVWRDCSLMLLLAGIGLVCAVTAQYFAARAATGFATKLRSAVYSHIGTLSYRELDQIGTSTMITRLTGDINQIQTGTNVCLRLLLRSPIVVFGATVMAFTIDAKTAGVFAVTVPVLSGIVFGVMAASIPLYRKVQEKLDAVTRTTRENLNGVRVLRAFCKEPDEIQTYRAENRALAALQMVAGRISALTGPLTYIVINFGIILVIWIGARQVNSGVLITGQVVALYNYMSQILVELIKMANVIVSMTKSAACGNRVQSLLEISSSMKNGDRQAGNIQSVEMKNVCLRYAGDSGDSLCDISFSAQPGSRVGIIGGTGSGKTSLVNLIPRFYDATAGQILLGGVPITEYDLDSLRNRIAVVPQKAALFYGTIRENLLWGNESATDEELMQAIRMAQAEDVVQKKGGLDAVIEQSGRNLSGGQRQRLTIARALVRNSDILILDDSASALDFATDAALRKALSALKGKTTVFTVSQRTSSIRHCDLILVLDGGKLVGKGTHEELMQNCPVYREIADSQFKKEDRRP